MIVTAVSPNVVIDIVLWLKIEKLGLYKGIHTIIIAVTTINDVLAIFCFNVVLGVIFSTGNLLTFTLECKPMCRHHCCLNNINYKFNMEFEQVHCISNYCKVPLALRLALYMDFCMAWWLAKHSHRRNRYVLNSQTFSIRKKRIFVFFLFSFTPSINRARVWTEPMSIDRFVCICMKFFFLGIFFNLFSVFFFVYSLSWDRNMRTDFGLLWWFWVVCCQLLAAEQLDLRRLVRWVAWYWHVYAVAVGKSQNT